MKVHMSRTSLVLCGACTVSLDLILQSTYLTLIHRYLLHDIATELLSQSFTLHPLGCHCSGRSWRQH